MKVIVGYLPQVIAEEAKRGDAMVVGIGDEWGKDALKKALLAQGVTVSDNVQKGAVTVMTAREIADGAVSGVGASVYMTVSMMRAGAGERAVAMLENSGNVRGLVVSTLYNGLYTFHM